MSREIDIQSTPFVFVYGTLKRGGYNNHRLSNSEFLGVAESLVESQLFDLGGFPCWNLLTPLSEAPVAPVRGELWRVHPEDFRLLDELEGHPRFFYRSQMDFRSDFDTYYVRAWTYFLNQPNAKLCPIVEGAYEWPTSANK